MRYKRQKEKAKEDIVLFACFIAKKYDVPFFFCDVPFFFWLRRRLMGLIWTGVTAWQAWPSMWRNREKRVGRQIRRIAERWRKRLADSRKEGGTVFGARRIGS
jgi:hypothetical protein